MSYQADISAAILASEAITALIADRFSWDVADGETIAPYLVAQTVSGTSETTHDGDRSLTFPLIQFSCWSKSKDLALAVMAAFKTDIEGVTLPGSSSASLIFSGENSTHDIETDLFGVIVDYRASAHTN